MAFRGSMDHRGYLRRSNPENEQFFISDILLFLTAREIVQLVFRSCVYANCTLHITLSALLTNDMFLHYHKLLSHLSLPSHLISTSASVHPHSPLQSSIFPTSLSHICLSSWYWKLVCHTVYLFCPNSFTCKYSLEGVIGWIQGSWFLKHHKYFTIAETCLRYIGGA